MNLSSCTSLPGTHLNGVWYRQIEPQFIATALSSAHTKVTPSRFNAGRYFASADQFEILYFADDPLVASFEVGAVLGEFVHGGYVPHPRKTYLTLNVSIYLHHVVDLTQIVAQTAIGMDAQALTGDWRGYQLRSYSTPVSAPIGFAPTQELGLELFRTKTEGFLTVSSKMPTNQVLAVFPQNLRRHSRLIFSDPSGKIVHEIKGR